MRDARARARRHERRKNKGRACDAVRWGARLNKHVRFPRTELNSFFMVIAAEISARERERKGEERGGRERKRGEERGSGVLALLLAATAWKSMQGQRKTGKKTDCGIGRFRENARRGRSKREREDRDERERERKGRRAEEES